MWYRLYSWAFTHLHVAVWQQIGGYSHQSLKFYYACRLYVYWGHFEFIQWSQIIINTSIYVNIAEILAWHVCGINCLVVWGTSKDTGHIIQLSEKLTEWPCKYSRFLKRWKLWLQATVQVTLLYQHCWIWDFKCDQWQSSQVALPIAPGIQCLVMVVSYRLH